MRSLGVSPRLSRIQSKLAPPLLAAVTAIRQKPDAKERYLGLEVYLIPNWGISRIFRRSLTILGRELHGVRE